MQVSRFVNEEFVYDVKGHTKTETVEFINWANSIKAIPKKEIDKIYSSWKILSCLGFTTGTHTKELEEEIKKLELEEQREKSKIE